MTREQYIDLLKELEGFRDRVYLDTKGIPTCGWGHALLPYSRVPVSVCEIFFAEDLAQVEANYLQLGLLLDPVREAVVKCMLFQLGLGGVRKFLQFLEAARNGQWDLAAAHMLDSKWARQDSPRRALRLSQMFASGAYAA